MAGHFRRKGGDGGDDVGKEEENSRFGMRIDGARRDKLDTRMCTRQQTLALSMHRDRLDVLVKDAAAYADADCDVERRSLL